MVRNISTKFRHTICRLQRRSICASVLLCFLANCFKTGSLSLCPRTNGEYASSSQLRPHGIVKDYTSSSTPLSLHHSAISGRASHGCNSTWFTLSTPALPFPLTASSFSMYSSSSSR